MNRKRFGAESNLIGPVEAHGFDEYRRTLTDVRLPDGTTSITRLSRMADAGCTGSVRRGVRRSRG